MELLLLCVYHTGMMKLAVQICLESITYVVSAIYLEIHFIVRFENIVVKCVPVRLVVPVGRDSL